MPYEYSQKLRKTIIKRGIQAKVKALLSGKEIELALGISFGTWKVIHETLKLGQALQISEVPNPSMMKSNLRRWGKRNEEKFPILKRMHVAERVAEGKVIVYFDPIEGG